MMHGSENIKYGPSSLYGYQFVNQEILYSLSLHNTFLHDQYVMQDIMNSLFMNFIILILSTFRTKLLASKHLITLETTKFDTE
jgi:hypothetical protein